MPPQALIATITETSRLPFPLSASTQRQKHIPARVFLERNTGGHDVVQLVGKIMIVELGA